MNAIIIFVAAIVSLEAANSLLYAFDCDEGESHYIGTRKYIYDNEKNLAEWLLDRRVFKEADPATGFFNGSVIVAHDNSVYRRVCKKIFLHPAQKDSCYHGGTARTRTEDGNIAFVGQDGIAVRKPSRIKCPLSWTKAYIRQSIENDHASSAIAQARSRLPMEDLSNLLNLESAINNLEVMLETGANRNETATANTKIQRYYKKYISPILTYYGMAYVIYTTALTSVALGLRVNLFRATKIAFPWLRRLSDLLSYRRDLIMRRQAERLRQIRRQEGLEDPPPLLDYTIEHFQNIYQALMVINQRLDTIAPVPPEDESDSGSTRSPSPSPRPAQVRHQMRAIQPRPSPRQQRPMPGRVRRVSYRATRAIADRQGNNALARRVARP